MPDGEEDKLKIKLGHKASGQRVWQVRERITLGIRSMVCASSLLAYHDTLSMPRRSRHVAARVGFGNSTVF